MDFLRLKKITAIEYWSWMNELRCFNGKNSKKPESYKENNKFVKNKQKVVYFVTV